MPKIKVPRKNTHMDMTAMCDVAFLLLTFFILTAKFRPNELVQIKIPSSRATETVKDDLVTISVDKDGNAFYTAASPRRKGEILTKMIEKYAVKYEINMLRCIFCGLCEEACPKDAIYLSQTFAPANYARKGFIYKKEDLLIPHPVLDKEAYDKAVGGRVLLSYP